ncbi:MAG: hypothetical protein A2X94_14930 [Bdellovibrionales bacterium GWB1_55_8]|nr:MAG: hypothetical protein A2X94_14930 [Bdellovibrionales bacterium GWB1_55_8]
MASIERHLTNSRELLQQLQHDDFGFQKMALALKELAGIHMIPNEKNRCLMAGRLSSVLFKSGIRDYSEYHRLIRSGNAAAIQEFISALTTNTTEFFREARHFEVLRELLPELAAAKRKQLVPEIRIWCAAASTGQEPYTILMTLLESLPSLADWQIRFLATDIDQTVLARAAAGVYTAAEVAGIPPNLRQKYFSTRTSDKVTSYVVLPQYRNMIRFAPMNLSEASYPFQHRFDIAFCRNVLIYFDRDSAGKVIEKIASHLNPGGFLFVGHSETGLTKTSLLKPFANAIYRRNP